MIAPRCHGKLNGASTEQGYFLPTCSPREDRGPGLVDIFTLALTHGLLAVAVWRLLFRPELDGEEDAAGRDRPWLRKRAEPTPPGATDA